MSMVRYLILRTLIFVGCLAATYLLGLRDREDQLLAVVIAAVASLVISAVVLRPFRHQASADIAARVERRSAARRSGGPVEESDDEAAEDAEIQRPVARPVRDGEAAEDSDFR